MGRQYFWHRIYQLTHENLIPSVLVLVGELSDDVEKANALLERRTNEWLGIQCLKPINLNIFKNQS